MAARPGMTEAGDQRVDILLVDDREGQRLALATLLGDLDVNVVEAASGREALRLLLQREFALILLDVNMPGMDGFETAALIRERKASERTPIIFVTAYGDDTFALRGYSLGAVDYVLAPVDPQVLKTKVSVFVELFRQSEQLKRQAASLEGHVSRLKRLAEASIELHAAREVDALLEVVAESAAALIGAQEVSASLAVPPSAPLSRSGARVGRHVVKRPETTALDVIELTELAGGPARRVRKTREECAGAARRDGALSLAGWLAAPLCATDGRPMGWLQLSDKREGEFDHEDELLLVQLAQMASIAAGNVFFDQAREANRIKDQFLATLSHELRTPLQTILTWACMLRQEGPAGVELRDTDLVARGLEAIERNARAQTRLIEDLLDVSRIVTGKLTLEKRMLPVGEAIDTAVEDAGPLARERGVGLEVAIGCPEAWLNGDPHRLRQVLGNLISNAIKFTPAGGQVTIECETAPGPPPTVEVRVRDTGKGIAAEFLPHLFEPFRQAESSSTRSHAGLGIGLAIVRHLVELHDGVVWAESEGEGKGATIRIRLPLGSGSPAVARVETVRTGEELRLAGLRVLVVDDEPDARASLALTLQQYGALVSTAGSVKEALGILESEAIDVLLSDLAMPGEDGFSLVRKLRARPELARLPAAALSAYVRSGQHSEGELAGFDLHLAKPIEPVVLAAAVGRLVSRPRGR
jgi:signal transduction histidine kinase